MAYADRRLCVDSTQSNFDKAAVRDDSGADGR